MSQLKRTSTSNSPTTSNGPAKGFRLGRSNAKIWGVCSGISNYTGIDPLYIRVAFVVGALVSVGTAALIYAAVGLIAD